MSAGASAARTSLWRQVHHPSDPRSTTHAARRQHGQGLTDNNTHATCRRAKQRRATHDGRSIRTRDTRRSEQGRRQPALTSHCDCRWLGARRLGRCGDRRPGTHTIPRGPINSPLPAVEPPHRRRAAGLHARQVTARATRWPTKRRGYRSYNKVVSVLSAALSDPDATSAARLRGGIGPRIRGL